MKSTQVRNALITLFILGCIAFFAWWSMSKPRILVLHSYDSQYPWTREINVGIRRVLGGKTGYTLRYHYLDGKHHPSPEFMAKAAVAARRVIDEWHPDLVIAVDDDAQQYVMKDFVNHPRIRVVFAGLNGQYKPYGYGDARNVTGIMERIPWRAIKDLLVVSNLRLAKGDLRLLHIADRGSSASEDIDDLRKFDWAPFDPPRIRQVATFEEWKAEVERAEREADIILIGDYRLLVRSPGSTEFVDPREVVAWTEKHSKLPLIGFKVAYGEEGGSLAVSASPYEQGDVAARMALRILEKNVSPDDIPIEFGRQFVVSVNEERVEAHGLRVPALHEAFARATNTFR